MGRRIADLTDGTTVDSTFLLVRLQRQTTRTGADYLAVTLRDVTGEIPGRVWELSAIDVDALAPAHPCRVRGRVERFREELQLNIEAIAPYTPIGAELDELVRCSVWPGDALVAEIRAHVRAGIRAPVLRALLLAVLDDPIVHERLAIWPAASRNHHAYRGGLAEHILSGMRLGSAICAHYAAYYPGLVCEDLVVAGFLLHDLMKLLEMTGEGITEYTTPGKLLGHIPMGALFIERIARRQGDVPEALLWELQHIILAHHGEYAFGSPKVPKTIEAQIVHYIDQVDAKVNMFAALQVADDGWGYDRTLRRPVLDGRRLRESWAVVDETPRAARGPGRPVDASAAAVDAAAQPGGVAAAPEGAPATTRNLSLFDGI